MRKLNFFALALLAVTFFACDDDDGDDDNGGPSNGGNETVTVSENVTEDETWSSDQIYRLADRISVTNDATLTIEPGTIIKGEAGRGANSTALVVGRNGKIDAEGTPDEPIIFTSVADEIQPGEGVASPNLAPDQNGLWGGVLILGKAPISAESTPNQVEGIPTDDETGLYGGSNPSHSSGTFKYVSIRHGGANIGEGNEINGLTLAGVGTGTTVEHIEVVANQDDGIECFGGTVNLTNAMVWNQADDAYDMDQAYQGTIDNVLAVEESRSDHGLELDGPEGQSEGTYTIRNATIKGAQGSGNQYADLRDDCTTNLENIYFFNYPSNATFELNDEATAQNYLNGNVQLSNIEINVDHLDGDGNTTIDEIFLVDEGSTEAFNQQAPDAETVSSPNEAGADKASLQWTWAGNAGALSNL